MPLSASEIKRQILMEAKNSPIREKIDNASVGLSDDDRIEMGEALESTTKTKGWSYIEAFMLQRMNIVGLVFDASGLDEKIQKGITRGYIELMQYLDTAIKKKNQIIDERKKSDAKAKAV